MTRSPSDRLVHHSTILMVAAAISAAANLLYHMVLGRLLSSDEYKLLVIALNTVMILLVPLEGIRTTLAHFASRLVKEGRRGDIRRLAVHWGGGLAACGLAALVLAAVGAESIETFFHLDDRRLLLCTAAVVAVVFVVPLFVGILQGLQSFYWMSLTLNLWAILRLILGTALVWYVAREAYLGMVAQLAGSMVGVLIGLLAVTLLLRGEKPSGRPVAGTYTYLGWSMLILLGFSILLNADILIIQRLLPDQAEFAARAGTIGRALVMLPMPIALAMFPKVTRAGVGDSATRATLIKALVMVLGLMLLTVGACLALPGLALRVLYGIREADPALVAMVRAYALAMSPLILIYLLMNYELAQHRFRACAGVPLAAVGLVAGAAWFHRDVLQVLTVLGAAGTLAVVVLARDMLSGAHSASREGEGT